MELDLEAIQSAIVQALPVHAHWSINNTPLDFDFPAGHKGLRPLPHDIIQQTEKEWFDLLIFGEYDYAEGGGASPWLGIRKTDGAVYGLDVERENPMFLLNSSIERFIHTFEVLNQYLAQGKQLPSSVEAVVRAIDPEVYPVSDWRSLVDCMKEGA
jgi:hypothetical protein